MAFRLKLGEPIEKGFRRAGLEQIERARKQLSARVDAASEVHEARKCIKRVRALLRLGRHGLGETVFRAENAHFRAIGNALAPARDTHVMVETIVKLLAEDDHDAAPGLRALKEAIVAEVRSLPDDADLTRSEADAALERAQKRFRRLALKPDEFSALELGLVHNYRRGLERRALAFAEGHDEAFHDWRKTVQAHWRHLALISKAWPALFDAQIATARELAQVLGDDHDLAMLRHKIRGVSPDVLARAEAAKIEALVAKRQEALRAAAGPLGAKVFAERPKALGRRISAIWEAAAARSDDTEVKAAPAAKKPVAGKATADARS